MTTKTKFIIELYEIGYSCRNIAEMFEMKKNSVLALLRLHKKLRPSLGIDIEKRVTEKLGAQRMPGDCYFDLLWNGKKIDVKSSRRSSDGRYRFMLHTKADKRKSTHVVDYYLLVKTDTMEMYLLDSHLLPENMTTLNLGNKYKHDYLGIL